MKKIATKSNKVTRNQIKVGRWCRTIWNDVGAKDCVIVGVSGDDITVYSPYDSHVERVRRDQVVAVGNMLEAHYSGL